MAKNKLKTCEERSELYSFLAGIYREEPTIALIKTLYQKNIKSQFEQLGIFLFKDVQEANSETFVEELVLEYTKLFIGPGKHISVNASVWCDSSHMLWTDTTAWVKEFIVSTGLDYSDSWYGMPDHISVEFEFMSKLILYESIARKNDDTEQVSSSLKLEKQFIHKHLTKWIPLFCDQIIKDTTNTFYSEIANLTKQFLENEDKLLM